MFPANYRQVLTTPLFKMHECYQHRYTAAQFPNTHIPSNVMRQLFAKSRINTWQQTNPMAIAWPRTQIYLSFTNLLHFFSSHTLFPLISTSSSTSSTSLSPPTHCTVTNCGSFALSPPPPPPSPPPPPPSTSSTCSTSLSPPTHCARLWEWEVSLSPPHDPHLRSRWCTLKRLLSRVQQYADWIS